VPTDPFRLSRRTALRAAALAAGAAAVLAGCDSAPDRSGTPGSTEDPNVTPQPPPPSSDPVIVAALQIAATQVQQLALRYSTVTQKFPALRNQLSTGVNFHASHLAKLKETGALKPAQPGKLPPLPTSSAAALADLASREQKLCVAHATAAAKLSGQAARLLASIAASESQLAATLSRKAAK
jgi:alkanesulfonate monooxygenase SsuD/methylene tetrahydromethanopterin reductase-like flavin-dependent oxidoreductase (luciferase family)